MASKHGKMRKNDEMAEPNGGDGRARVEAIRAYDRDYAGWAEDTAQAIEDGRFEDIDRVALADEVRDWSKTERARTGSALRVLLIHLLKAKYQPEKHTRSCDHTISIQRLHVARYLRESPSLRAKLDELIGNAYETARYDAENETGLMLDIFPEVCEWTAVELLGDV